jgi:NADPH:quinone reductase-like Zn-dependent oxidoreductase
VRAPVFRGHGVPAEVLELASLPDPGPPAPGQVLIRVLVRPIHPGDLVGGARAAGRAGAGTAVAAEGDLAAALDHVACLGKDGTVLLTNPIPE